MRSSSLASILSHVWPVPAVFLPHNYFATQSVVLTCTSSLRFDEAHAEDESMYFFLGPCLAVWWELETACTHQQMIPIRIYASQ
eukprot:4540571-Amphidinium_carterae.1